MTVSVEPLTAAFNVSVNDELWLRGLPPFPGWPGASPLKLMKRAETSGTHSTLGTYAEQRFFWSASDGISVETAFQLFTDGETVLFEQSFPQGLNNSISTGAVILLRSLSHATLLARLPHRLVTKCRTCGCVC